MLLIAIYMGSLFVKSTTFLNTKLSRNVDKVIIVHITDKDLYLDLEDYLIGVVSAEMPALFNEEALKAQAVAARSYAVSKVDNGIINVVSTTGDQVYQDNYELVNKWKNNYDEYYKKIFKAVCDTKNLVIKRDGKVLKTYYFSMSNGKTENSVSVFGDNNFVSVDSPYEVGLKNFIVETDFSKDEILKLLNIDDFKVGNIKRNESNRVDTIEINNHIFSGTKIRSLLGLRSTDFEIKTNGDDIKIITRGYGHGVGMSQYGANEMAKKGYNYKEILNHYYKNSVLKEI